MTCSERRHPHWRACAGVCWATLVVVGGCDSKLDRFDLSGEVTYRGQPVPAGYLVLKPDSASGNKGPGSAANIVNGHYATSPGRGTIGGPHVVTVFGFDGKEYMAAGGVPNPMGKPVFKSDIKAELPTQSGTHDFEVPVQRK